MPHQANRIDNWIFCALMCFLLFLFFNGRTACRWVDWRPNCRFPLLGLEYGTCFTPPLACGVLVACIGSTAVPHLDTSSRTGFSLPVQVRQTSSLQVRRVGELPREDRSWCDGNRITLVGLLSSICILGDRRPYMSSSGHRCNRHVPSPNARSEKSLESSSGT